MAIDFRFLQESDFNAVHQAFISAFSTYAVKMQPTASQLRETMNRRGMRWDLSVGAFDSAALVAFNLNGFGNFDSLPTVYDLGTGVTPDYRGQNLTRKMFDFSLARLREAGARRYLLEVLESNAAAAHSYEQVGFTDRRKLDCFTLTAPIATGDHGFDLRSIEKPSWNDLGAMCDFTPSWQNSTESILRSREPRYVIGAWEEGRLCGYGVVYPSIGDVAQLAVARDVRRRGVGTALTAELQHRSDSGSLRFINIDASSNEMISFLESIGAAKFISQREMVLSL